MCALFCVSELFRLALTGCQGMERERKKERRRVTDDVVLRLNYRQAAALQRYGAAGISHKSVSLVAMSRRVIHMLAWLDW